MAGVPIKHLATGATSTVPERSLPHWLGAGWVRADTNSTAIDEARDATGSQARAENPRRTDKEQRP